MQASGYVGQRVILQSVVSLFLCTIENSILESILLKLTNKFYVQVNGFVYVVRD